jgi:hypothetical protein
MRGILIDPTARTVSYVEVGNELRDIYDAIKADTLDVVALPNRDAIYVDDEGLHRKDQDFFAIGSRVQPLAGRALILGLNNEGGSVSVSASVELIRANVRWLAPQEVVERYAEAKAAAHAHKTIEDARGSDTFHVVAFPDVEIDPETGKARAL